MKIFTSMTNPLVDAWTKKQSLQGAVITGEGAVITKDEFNEFLRIITQSGGDIPDGAFVEGVFKDFQWLDQLSRLPKLHLMDCRVERLEWIGTAQRKLRLPWEVHFERCEFSGPMKIQHAVSSEKVHWQKCDMRDRCDLQDSSFKGEFEIDFIPPEKMRAARTRSVYLAKSVPENADVAIERCRFHGKTEIRMNLGRVAELKVGESHFVSPSSHAEVTVHDFRNIRLNSTHIAGRFELRLMRERLASPPLLSLRGTMLTGLMKIVDRAECTVHIHEAELLGDGRIDFPVRSPLYLHQLRERLQTSRDSEDDDEADTALAEDHKLFHRSLAKQYAFLRDGHARDWTLQDYCDECHYRHRIHGWHAEVRDCGFRFVCVAGFGLVCLAICAVLGLRCLPLGIAGGLGITTWAGCVRCRPDWMCSRAFRLVSELIVIRGAAGYGVRFVNVLFSSLALIFSFGLVYLWLANWSPDLGTVVNGGNAAAFSTNLPVVATTSPNGTTIHWGNFCEQWQRALYFSTITFTTLGYGDYHPTGRLQIVAGVEALTGAVMIALLTVVFARKFLRF
jgi:hypothetical protein